MKMYKDLTKLLLWASVTIGLISSCTDTSHTVSVSQMTTEDNDTARNESIDVTNVSSNSMIPDAARRIMAAYPDTEMDYHDNHLIVNGERIIFDDGKQKSFVELLDHCDVDDMFSMQYDTTSTTPSYLSDAGRGRCESLFKAMYGHEAQQVAKKLVTIEWFGQKLRFTSVNGAARQLEKVAKELSLHTEWRKYFSQSSTVYWRKVRGAQRQSAHSYGIAIDICVAKSDYWLWDNPNKGELDTIRYKNRIPYEIVKVFERNGFIWGGRWYHYDTMHFEYRPELIVK